MKIVQIGAIWCSSCLVMEKIYQRCQKKFDTLTWSTYDLDFNEEEVSHYHVGEKIPVLIFEKDGEIVSRLVGEKSEEEVITWIEENIGS